MICRLAVLVVLSMSAALAQSAPKFSDSVKQYIKYSTPRIVLTHVRVIDGTGRDAVDDRNVVIENGVGKNSGDLVIVKGDGRVRGFEHRSHGGTEQGGRGPKEGRTWATHPTITHLRDIRVASGLVLSSADESQLVSGGIYGR